MLVWGAGPAQPKAWGSGAVGGHISLTAQRGRGDRVPGGVAMLPSGLSTLPAWRGAEAGGVTHVHAKLRPAVREPDVIESFSEPQNSKNSSISKH